MLSSCTIGLEADDPGFSDFQAAYALWASHDLKEYTFEIQRHCLCAPPKALIVSVKDEKVVDFELLQAEVARFSEYYSVEQLRKQAETQTITIKELFSMIQESLQGKSIAEIRIIYNEQYGFPESIFIDSDRDYTDEEIDMSILNFRVE